MLDITIIIYKSMWLSCSWWTRINILNKVNKCCDDKVLHELIRQMWWQMKCCWLGLWTMNVSYFVDGKGWGAIAKLKKKQELLVRFGYNLGELFRDSPWSYNPLYTQIGQVNKSTLRVNTMVAVPEISSTKQREGLVRFGYNLGDLFRYSPWSYNPLCTQIGQVNKSTLKVNTMDAIT